jgi:leucyl aminopeptidase
MLTCFVSDTKDEVITITPVCEGCFTKWLDVQPERIKNLVSANRFSAESNDVLLIPDQNGSLEKVLLGLKTPDDSFAFGVLPKALPFGYYIIDAPEFSSQQLEQAAICWGMGSYQFTRYKKTKVVDAKLVCKDNYDINKIDNLVSGIFWVRDLINTPASDLYPEKLAEIAQDLAKEFGADFNKVSGEELRKDFPAIHAVGCGSEKKPVLIDLRFGDANAPKVVLVGKGVCFDSGGLQLKFSSAMITMKKDMAGAAHALGLARMIMLAKLPINLRVIIPAVENLISGDSLKPGDVITTRKGLTVETKNTDAEGRLILADALAFASEWKPELILDFATLTSAARVALGSDIVALFSSDDQLAQDIIDAMSKEQEPVWRMPLYQPYLEFLKSKLADFQNISTLEGPTAGAITAALVLQQFVLPQIPWAHFDMHAYNDRTESGRPEGGEAECIRGVFRYLKGKFDSRMS